MGIPGCQPKDEPAVPSAKGNPDDPKNGFVKRHEGFLKDKEELLKKDAVALAAKAAQASELRYQQLVAQGQALMGQKKYAAAVADLQEAIKIRRGEPAGGRHFSSSTARRLVISSRSEVVGLLSSTSL